MITSVKIAVAIGLAAIVTLCFCLALAKEPARKVYVNDRVESERLNMRLRARMLSQLRRECLAKQGDVQRSLVSSTFRLAASTARLANLLEANRG